jgi:hypothetical protein
MLRKTEFEPQSSQSTQREVKRGFLVKGSMGTDAIKFCEVVTSYFGRFGVNFDNYSNLCALCVLCGSI